MSELGDCLKLCREKLGVSLSFVEEKTGVTNSRLSKIERGKISNPPAEDLKRLANLYGVSVVEIFIVAGYLESADLTEYQQIFHGVQLLDTEERELIQNNIDMLNRGKELI